MSERLRIELERAGAAQANLERRTIEGTLVPYGEVGVAHVDGAPREVRFIAGALELGRDRIPLVAGHDQDSPLGVLTGLTDTGFQELRAAFKIDATPAGDAALVQAASGSRAGLSAGALAHEWREAAAGVIEVTAARLFHVGLVSIPAMPSAQVSRVAAASAETKGNGGTMAQEDFAELAASIDADTPDDELERLLEHDDPAVKAAAEAERDRRHAEETSNGDDANGDDANGEQGTLTASRARSSSRERPTVLAGRAGARPRELELKCSGGELVLSMVRAQTGDKRAARMVEAVLAEIASTDVPGLVPPAYTTDILGELPTVRPLADRVAAKRPMPATGMTFTKPKWVTKPSGGWVAELADIPSNAPDIDSQDVTVLEWAYGIAMSYAVATRSSPDAIESIFRAAVADYYSDVEQKIADALMSTDQPGGVGAGVGSAIAAFYGDEKTGPDLLVVAPDIYGDLVDAIDTVPTYSAGEVSGAKLTGTIAGLEVVVSGHLPAGAELVTARGAIELRETSPVRLTANVIGALKVELAATAFASFDVERPNAVHSLTPAAGMEAGESVAKATAKKK